MLLFLTLLFYLGISYKLKGTFLRAHFDNPGQVYTLVGFLGGSDGKESACDEGDLGSVPGLGRSPGGGHGNPLQYSCLENPHGQRSLAGYSPWDRRVGMTAHIFLHKQLVHRICLYSPKFP